MAVYMLIVGFCILQDSLDDIAGFLLGSVDDNAGVLHGSVDDNAGVLPELTPNHGHPLLCLPHSFLHLCLERRDREGGVLSPTLSPPFSACDPPFPSPSPIDLWK